MNNFSYEKLLRDQKAFTYTQPVKKGSFATPRKYLIPPLNTDIRFSSVLNEEKRQPIGKYLTTTPLEKNFSWKTVSENDSEEIVERKKNISKVGNQFLCGSCSNFAVAGCISDVFVCSGITKTNPEISATYIMACYPQLMCGGANPAITMQNVADGGAKSNACVDYSWCSDDSKCNGMGEMHFDAQSLTHELNAKVPKCGAISSCDARKRFYISNPTVVHREGNEDMSIIKSHIRNTGPVIGGYHVLSNFFGGDYSSTGGVYIESYDYENDAWYEPGQEAVWRGSHAVVVLGWGVAEGVDRYGDVPYWMCRNSWGEEWGADEGYFKIAMFPVNKKSQFETLVRVGNALSGGFVLCEPGEIHDEEGTGEGVVKATGRGTLRSKSESRAYVYISIFLVLLLVVIIIYYYSRENN